MTESHISAGARRRQSPLSEAFEQAAAAASAWQCDLAKFAEHEADLLSSGQYSGRDAATAPVRLLRIWVRNTVKTASMMSDNLALLSAGRSGGPRERTLGLRVDVPAGVIPDFHSSDLVGRLLAHRIPHQRVHINPRKRVRMVARAKPMTLNLDVRINTTGAPTDTYMGVLTSIDRKVTLPLRVAVDEIGEPLP